MTDDGSFQATADPTSIPAEYREPDGTVDFTIFATDGKNESSWTFSAVYSSDGTSGTDGWVTDRSGDESENHTDQVVNFDLEGSPSVTDMSRTFKSTKQPVSPLWDQPACWVEAKEWHNGLYEVFARLIADDNGPASMFQSAGTDHSLGIAVKGGAAASWTAGGTVKRSLAGEGADPFFVGSYTVWNRVNYRDFLDQCDGTWYRQPNGTYDILADYRNTGTPNWTACALKSQLGTYSKYGGTNATYSGGVDVGPIAVSAQSGWNQETKITWKVVNSRGILLCGSEPVGWVSAKEAMSKNP